MKKPYQKPELVTLGSFSALTEGNSGSFLDVGGEAGSELPTTD